VIFTPSTGPGNYAGNTAMLQVISNNGTTIVLATAAGGLLTFTFSGAGAGQYSYEVPNTDTDDSITYTIADGDGDTATATLVLQNTADPIQEPDTVFGDNKNNNLNGTGAIDIIGGDDGNDTASGGGGDDHITGGAGADSLSGGSGNDIIIGGSTSQNENQSVRAADGNDTLAGGSGADLLIGNDGDDLIIIGVGDNDTVIGGGTADVDLDDADGDIMAFNGNLNLTAVDNNTISGIERVSMLDSHAGAGSDTLTLNAADVISMGTGEFDPSGSFDPAGSTNLGNLSNEDAVRVEGEAGDTLNLTGGGWFLVGAANTQGGPAGYNLYVHAAGNAEDAYVIVDNDIVVNVS
jgi:Ca2+-binding RTX toxin-like protein